MVYEIKFLHMSIHYLRIFIMNVAINFKNGYGH
jgi:hypothetical protein